MTERVALQRGMPVRGLRGRPLGRVLACGERYFLVRSPVLRRRFSVAYDDVGSLARGVVRLPGGRELCRPASLAQAEAPLMTVRPLDPRFERVGAAARGSSQK